jgi:hypothetical protein
LERHAFVADESQVLSNPLVISTAKFLTKHCSSQLRSWKSGNATNSNGSSSAVSGAATALRLAVSLSGGVVSMVIAKILVILRREKLLPPDTAIIALHIDYANRDESSREASFVADWCESLGIVFEQRVIDEVTRGVTDRTEYEKISREIRYGFYQQMLKKYNCPGVMFGHHLGDVQENVISNVFR